MMDISPKVHVNVPLISAYGVSGITCSGQVYTSSIIIREQGVCVWQGVNEHNALSWESLQQIFEGDDMVWNKPEIVLVGMGENTSFLSPSIRQKVSALGASIDVMSCGAACRTYNILIAEGRKVVAAIVPISRDV